MSASPFIVSVFAVTFLSTIGGCIDVNLRVGDTVRLFPEKVSAKITSVVWKYGKNLLAEWTDGQIPVTYYSKFNGRTTLDIETGSVTFENATVSDTSTYSVEINNLVQALMYRIVIMENVPQPMVEITPVLCNSTLDMCTLICEGDVSKAGPVTYFWRMDTGEWLQCGREKEISNNQDMWTVRNISCRIENPLGGRDSDCVSNPFYQEDTGMGSYVTLGIVLGSVALLAPVLATLCLCCPRKNKCNAT